MNHSSNQLESLYQKDYIAKSYIDERFSRPLGRVQHRSQVDCVNRIIHKYKARSVLEIACGPARLTAEVKGFEQGIAVDRSHVMLEIASSRTPVEFPWQFVKGDAFNLNFKRKFDLVYSFRFIRHLRLKGRNRIYDQIKMVLKPKGLFVFDAVRHDKPLFLKKYETGGKILVYDKVYDNKTELQDELIRADFELVELYSCIEHFYGQAFFSRISHILKKDHLGIRIIQFLEKIKTGCPLEWIVLCQKK